MSLDPTPASRRFAQLLEVVRVQGLQELDSPVQLASGAMSRHFVDGKLALAAPADLRLAAELFARKAADANLEWNAVGGLTMGADAIAIALALNSDNPWFLVRKERKDRGTRRLIEGLRLGPEHKVFVVDDVVTTGGSILEAVEAVEATGATLVGASTLVDRGDTALRMMKERGIPYLPLLTYKDLGIPAVGEPDDSRRLTTVS